MQQPNGSSTPIASTPIGVWECRNCRSRNLGRLERCATCDCINPRVLSPRQGSPRLPATTERLTKFTDALPSSYASRGASAGSLHASRSVRQSPSPLRTSSPKRQIMTYQTPFRGLEALFSPAQERSPPHNIEASSLSASHRSPMGAPNPTATELHAQLSQAVASHKALMQEYAELNKHCDAQEVAVDKLRKDMKFLDDLYQRTQHDARAAQGRLEAEREAFDRDRHRYEVENGRLRRLVDERDALLETKRLEWEATSERRQREASEERSVRRKEREEREERIASLERDLKVLRAEHTMQVTEQAQQAKELREQFALERDQYVEAAQRAHREMTAAHQEDRQHMCDEVHAAKGLSSMLAQTERQMLLERVEHEQRMRCEADQRRERETSSLASEVEQLKKSLEYTGKQRDELMSEAKFQLEMMSELRTEKAACKAELAALRIVVGSEASSIRRAGSDGTSVSRLTAPMTPPRTLSPPPQTTEKQRLEEALRTEQERAAALEEALNTLRGQVLEERQSARTALEAAVRDAATREEDATEALSGVQMQLQLSQAKVEALQSQNERLKDDLDGETTAHEATKQQLENVEMSSHDKAASAARRLEAANVSLNEQQQENGRLVEECDALRIAVEDMEQVLADALAARGLDGHITSTIGLEEGPVRAL